MKSTFLLTIEALIAYLLIYKWSTYSKKQLNIAIVL